MARKQFRNNAGGIISTLIVVLLLAVTVWLYLQIVMVDSNATVASEGDDSTPQASVQVLEGDEPQTSATTPAPLPEDQMAVIKQLFAPENPAN